MRVARAEYVQWEHDKVEVAKKVRVKDLKQMVRRKI